MVLSPLFGWLRPDAGRDERALLAHLGLMPEDLDRLEVAYETFRVPKRTGGLRTLEAPNPPLKELQRRLLHRVLGGIRAHPAAHGFERGRSIATHARLHAHQAVVLKLDVVDFFGATEAGRVEAFYRRIGWNRAAAKRLTTWTTWKGALPQGAPTSPRLSNLLNTRLDARLDGLARTTGGVYSRYADDLAFSWDVDAHERVNGTLATTKKVLAEEGYRLHTDKKLRITRRHDRQLVTGLVVNDGVRLPRATRRRLRAIRHHVATGRPATLTAEQLEGWRALEAMVARQGGDGG